MFDFQVPILNRDDFFNQYGKYFSHEIERKLKNELIFPQDLDQIDYQDGSITLVLSAADIRFLTNFFNVIENLADFAFYDMNKSRNKAGAPMKEKTSEPALQINSIIQLVVLLGQQEAHVACYINSAAVSDPNYNMQAFRQGLEQEIAPKTFMGEVMRAFCSAKDEKDYLGFNNFCNNPWVVLVLAVLADHGGNITYDIFDRETNKFLRTKTEKFQAFILDQLVPSHYMHNSLLKTSPCRALAIDVMLSKFFLSDQIPSPEETAVFLEKISEDLWREVELDPQTRRCYKSTVGQNYATPHWRKLYSIREHLLARIISYPRNGSPADEVQLERLIANMVLLEGRLVGSFDERCDITNPNVGVFRDFLKLPSVDDKDLKEKIWHTCAIYLPRMFADFITISNKAYEKENKFLGFLSEVLGSSINADEIFKQHIVDKLFLKLQQDDLPFVSFNPKFFWLHCGENYSFPKLCGLAYKDEIFEKFKEAYEGAGREDKQKLSAAATQRDDQGNPTHSLAQAFDVGVSLHNRGEYQKGKGSTCKKLAAILHPENINRLARLMRGAGAHFSSGRDRELDTVDPTKTQTSNYLAYDSSFN